MPEQTSTNTTNNTAIRLPKELPLETSLWRFSLSIWKHPDAQSSLLFLQDEYGLKVNRLLFCCWLGFERRELIVDKLESDPVLAQWSNQTVAPLRSIRKQLKQVAPNHPQLKATVQNAELQAEQIEQALLFQKSEILSRPTTQKNTLQTLSYNLLSYTEHALQKADNESQVALKPHLITLVHAAIPNHDRVHIKAYFAK